MLVHSVEVGVILKKLLVHSLEIGVILEKLLVHSVEIGVILEKLLVHSVEIGVILENMLVHSIVLSCSHGDEYEDGCLLGHVVWYILADVPDVLTASTIRSYHHL
jgi:hypothetical protein